MVTRTHHLPYIPHITLPDLRKKMQIFSIGNMIAYGGIASNKRHIPLLSFAGIEEEPIRRPAIGIAVLFTTLPRKQQDEWIL
jgi:hypothetical protein